MGPKNPKEKTIIVEAQAVVAVEVVVEVILHHEVQGVEGKDVETEATARRHRHHHHQVVEAVKAEVEAEV